MKREFFLCNIYYFYSDYLRQLFFYEKKQSCKASYRNELNHLNLLEFLKRNIKRDFSNIFDIFVILIVDDPK